MKATATVDEVDAFRLLPGDVIITKDSETANDIGVAAYVERSSSDLVCGYHLAICRPRAMYVDSRFLFWAMNSDDTRGQLSYGATGVTRHGLRADVIGDVSIAVPSMCEQQAIAGYLDFETIRIDSLISTKRRLLELLYERKLTLGEEILFDLRQSEQSVPLKYLVRESDVRYGSGPEPTMLSVSIHHGVVPRSTVSDKESSAVNFSDYKVCRPGDIAINRMRAFQGGVGVVRHGGVVSPDYTVLRVGDRVSAGYLHFVMRSSWFVSEMTRRLRGIGSTDQGQVRTPRINFADLGLIEVPVPSSERQRSLALSLTEQEARLAGVVDLQVKQLAVLAERRQALITAVVTGELAIPEMSS